MNATKCCQKIFVRPDQHRFVNSHRIQIFCSSVLKSRVLTYLKESKVNRSSIFRSLLFSDQNRCLISKYYKFKCDISASNKNQMKFPLKRARANFLFFAMDLIQIRRKKNTKAIKWNEMKWKKHFASITTFSCLSSARSDIFDLKCKHRKWIIMFAVISSDFFFW